MHLSKALVQISGDYPAGIYLFKAFKGNIKATCEFCSNLQYKHQNGVNEVIKVVLGFEQVNAIWVVRNTNGTLVK